MKLAAMVAGSQWYYDSDEKVGYDSHDKCGKSVLSGKPQT